MAEQQYVDRLAVERMARGACPECGAPASAHTGWGGPGGCLLTDNGVAARIAAWRATTESQR